MCLKMHWPMVAKIIVMLNIILTKDYGFTLESRNGDLQTMTKEIFE